MIFTVDCFKPYHVRIILNHTGTVVHVQVPELEQVRVNSIIIT